MAQNFNIVAQLALRGPNNVRAVVRQISSQLNSINANVQINIANNVNTKLNRLNTNLQRINASILSIRQAGLQATAALQNLASVLNGIKSGGTSININAKALNNVAKSASKASDAMGSFGSQAGLAVRRFLAFAGPTTIFLGLVSAIKEGVVASIDFEKEMTRLSQVTGKSVASLSDLSGEITRLATGLGVSSKELGDVATTLAQAGLSAKDTKTALEALARSSLAATFTDIKSTTEGAIAVFRQFNVSADQLQGVIGSLNSVSAQFAVESDDLVSAIRRTGGAFKVSGGNLNELLGLFTSVRATTRESADSIATGFRTIFTRIQRPKTIQFLKELGVELQDAKGQFVGPVESIRRLNAALSDVPTTDPRFASIIEELGGFRQVSKVIPLIQQFPEALKAISVAEQGQQSIVEDSIIAQKSLANQIVKVKEEFLSLFRELTSDKSFQFFVKTSLELARSLIEVTRSIKPLIPLIGSLALIQTGRNIGSITSNFGKALGGNKRFARGGIVPGGGSGDTVPALLTPGEFVVNKKSAQAIGFNKLASMNKFAAGGPVRKFGVAGLKPFGLVEHENVLAQTEVNINGKKQKIKENVDIVSAGLSNSFAKKSEDTIRKSVGTAASSIAQNIQKQIGAEQSQRGDLSTVLKKSNFESTVGNIFESALALAGAPYTEISEKAIDFPKGLGEVAKVYGGKFPKDIPTEAKRTASIKDFRRRNLLSFLRDEAKKNGGSNIEKAISNRGSSSESSTPTNLNFTGIAKGKALSVAELAKYVGAPKLKFNDLKSLTSVDKEFERRTVGGSKMFIKRAAGGSIPGSGDGDTVPSMLTPGEFVLNKAAVDKIGVNNLNALNKQGFKKFARGGRVDNSGGSFNLTSGAFAISGIASLAPSFLELDKESKSLVSSFSAIAAASGAVIFSLNSIVNQEKLNRFKKITPGGNIFGGFGRNKVETTLLSTTKNLAKNFDHIALGVGALSAIITVAGQSIKDLALNAAKASKSELELSSAIAQDKRGSTLVGAGVGAGVGAAIGTVIAPGVGTLVGAGVGAAAGAAFGSSNTSENELIKAFKQSQFQQVSDKLDTLFDDIANNRLNKSRGTADIGNEIQNQINNIKSTGDSEQRGELTKQFRNNLINIRSLSQAIAEQVSDFNEFKTAFGGAGKSIVESISLLTKKSLPDVQKEIENEIDIRKKSIEAEKKRLEASKVFERITLSLTSFEEALHNVSDSLEQIGNKFETISTLGSGDISSGKFTSIPSDLFERAAAGKIGDATRVGGAATQLLGGIDSESAKAIGDKLTSLTLLQNKLPAILDKLASNVGLGEDEESAQKFFHNAIDQIEGLDKKLAQTTKNIFDAETSSRAGKGEGGLIADIRSNPKDVATKITSEANKESFASATNILKIVQEQLDNIGKGLIQQAQKQLNLSQQKSNLEEKLLDFTKSRLKEGETLTLEQVRRSVNRSRESTLSTTSFSDTGGVADIDAVKSRLIAITDELDKAKTAINSTESTREEQLKAIQKTVALSSESARLTKYLKDLGDSTVELTHLQDQLAKAESDRKSGKNLAQDLLFGEGSGRVAFSKFARNAQAINAGKGNIGDLVPNARKEFLDFLDKLPQNKSLSLLGGKKVEDFKNDQLRKSFNARAVKEGADTGAAAKLIDELTTISTEEADVRKKIEEVQNRSIKASEALITVEEALVEQLKILNAKTITTIIDKSKELADSIKRSGLEEEKRPLLNTLSGRKEAQDRLNKFTQSNFGSNVNQSIIGKIKQVRAFEKEFRTIGDSNKEQERIKSLNINKTDLVEKLSDTVRTGNVFGHGDIAQNRVNGALVGKFDNLGLDAEAFQTRLEKRLEKVRFHNGGPGFDFQPGQKISENLFKASNKDESKIALKTILDEEFNNFIIDKQKTELNKTSEANTKLSRSDLSNQDKVRFSNLTNLDSFLKDVQNLDKSFFDGEDSLKKYTKAIADLNLEIKNIESQISEIKPVEAEKRAMGGLISGRSISSPLVRFTPKGTDKIPAMLTAGEFVVRKDAAQANLPALQAMNAGGFARGGRISRRDRLTALASARRTKRNTFIASRSVNINALKEKRQISVEKALNRVNTNTSKDVPVGKVGDLAKADLAERVKSIKELNESTSNKIRAFEKRDHELALARNQQAIENRNFPLNNPIEENRKRVAALKLKQSRRQDEALGLNKFAKGGGVPGRGEGDTVPALLTPGEFVLNKKAARALGHGTLSNFNAKFANGGPVQASQSNSGGGVITIDQAGLSVLDSFNKTFVAATSTLNGSINRFSEVGLSLSNALSRWSNSATTLNETLAKFPTEIQVNHSPITVAVNVSGLEGLETAVTAKVLAAVNDRLASQNAKAAEGKSPFFSK